MTDPNHGWTNSSHGVTHVLISVTEPYHCITNPFNDKACVQVYVTDPCLGVPSYGEI